MKTYQNMSVYVNACFSMDSPSFIITEFPSDIYIQSQIAVCVVNCALMIPALILNGLCIITICKSHVFKGKFCFFLIMSQSVIDLLVTTITIPSYTYLIYSELVGTANCLHIFILNIIGLLPGGLSLAILCALTLERYLGILHPIFHRNRLSKKMFYIYVCVCTLVLLIGVPIAATSATVYYVGMNVVIGLSLIVNAVAYTKILIAIMGRFRTQRDGNTDSNSSQASRRRRFIEESKLVKSCAFVVGLFYACYLPGLVLCLYYIQVDKLKYRVAHSWYSTNFALNASVNSIIFFWKRPILRKEAWKVWKNIFHSENEIQQFSTTPGSTNLNSA